MKNSNLILLSVLLIFSFFPADVFAGTIPEVEWDNTYGGSDLDKAKSVRQTSDNGYIVAGYTYNPPPWVDYNVKIVKTDANGNKKWDKTYGGSGFNVNKAESVRQTSDGGYIITGVTDSFGAGEEDFWLIKTDANGNEEWNKTFGGSSADWGYSVQQTSDNGYVMAGWTQSFGEGGDVWLVKTDSNGNGEWNKTFGGLDNDGAYSVQQTSDNGYIMAGYTWSFGAGALDAWLIKTDPNGVKEWTKTFGGSNWDKISSVQQTSDNGYVMAGYTKSSGAGSKDFWLIKTDPNGNEEWNRTFGGSNADEAESVQQTSDNGYIIAGVTSLLSVSSSDFLLIKTDADGNEEWNKRIGGSSADLAYSVQQTSDNGYVMAGWTDSFGAGRSDFFLVKVIEASDSLAGDLDEDGRVDSFDLSILAKQWLLEKLSADISHDGGDGFVDFSDCAVFANAWQTTSEPQSANWNPKCDIAPDGGDGTVDMDDLTVFVNQWLQLSAYCADIAPEPDGDGTVNMLDFAILANNWLAGFN